MRIRTLTVSELNKYIKKVLMNDPILNNITLKGEISNFKIHGSGHIYCSLKDEESKINCIMFKRYVQDLKFEPYNGMTVIVKGYISIFERDGQYQMYINDMEPDGVGALHLAFEQLKEKLEKEGFFSPKHKKHIPDFPEKIAVVTSPTGAAIRDILSVIKRRNNYVDVLIYPVLVQGEYASSQIAQAIDKINKNAKEIDTLIVARGGGSIEELWAFNEEIVARSIYYSQIPVISAIGHETDYTIADFVSDLRAPTPSAAAELAVPCILDIKNKMELFYTRMNQLVFQELGEKRKELKLFHPESIKPSVCNKIHEGYQAIDMLQKDLSNYIRFKRENCQFKLINYVSKLKVMNPFETISRGYAIVLDENKKKLVDSVDCINIKDVVDIVLKDGRISCIVKHKEKEDNVLEYFHKFEA